MTRDDLIEALAQETKVIKHLVGKVPADRLDWRPTEGQRSMGELVRYLTHCGEIGLTNAITGNWDHAEELGRKSAEVTLDTAAQALDAQQERMAAQIRAIDESTLGEETPLPWGQPVRRGRALLEMGLKPMSAYRMQLFLYLKESGSPELNSMNCWIGIDAPPPATDGDDA